MSRDFQAEDEALDRELEALYTSEKEASEPEAPEEAGTASEEENEPIQSEAAPEDETDGTVVDDAKEESVEAEKTVPEERYQNAVKAMNKAQQELAALRKQDATRDELLRSLQAQVQQLQEAKVAKPQEESDPKDQEDDLAEAKELYPEVIGPMLKRIKDLQNELAKVNDSVTSVKSVADRYQKNEAKTAEEKHWDHIKSKHPDLDAIVASPEYAAWYPEQSPMIQQALNNGTAKDVVVALNLFRLDHPKDVPEAPVTDAPIANKPNRLAEAKKASSPTIKNGQKPDQKPTFTQAQIAKMTREEFNKHEAEIDAAMARREIQ